MISSNIANSPISNVEIFSLPNNQTTIRLLSFLEEWLPIFRYDYLNVYPSHLEDDISEKLVLFLQTKAKKNKLLFHFNAQKGVDFLIFIEPYNISAKPFFVIEAKRLPPTNNKDYVQGRTGGLERFKREQTGFDFQLNENAMVAYVQEKSFEHWFKMVNKWIDNLIAQNQMIEEINWLDEDKILGNSPKNQLFSRYISTHSRKTLGRLKTHHFWLNMKTSS